MEEKKVCLDYDDYVGQAEEYEDGYDAMQRALLRQAEDEGIDLLLYASTEYHGVALRELYYGLKNGINVSAYAHPDYCWRQMRELRLGIEHGIDITKYSSRLYSHSQMKEIRLGLEQGLDVGEYLNLMYASKDMHKIRIRLEQERNQRLSGEDKKYYEYDGFCISVSGDGMEAYIEANVDEISLEKSTVLKALEDSGVFKGILEEEIERFLNRKSGNGPAIVARGFLERQGKNGWYEFFFRSTVLHIPKILANGTVVYDNFDTYVTVDKGVKVAVYHEAEKGMNGFTVTGNVIRTKRGTDLPELQGKGLKRLPDKKTYISAQSGKIELVGDRVDITPFLVYDELYAANGSIYFDGSVHVRGNVHNGVYIKATGDVVIDGMVEAARIEADGSVLMKQGMKGIGVGLIHAKKHVIGRYFEALTIHAELGIQANQCVNCDIHTDGRLCVQGNTGIITGGTAYAGTGMEIQNAGTVPGVTTVLKLGTGEVVISGQLGTGVSVEMDGDVWNSKKLSKVVIKKHKEHLMAFNL